MTNHLTNLRWGVLGCARIAENAVIPGIAASQTGVVAAIASRSPDKAKETAEKHGIEAAYGSYEELLADSSIDAVYIPLPNHLHKDWTIRAAQAGKHVLCEKPIALNAQEAEEMVQACADAGVLLAEAFMYRHHPRYALMQEIIRSGEIGEIRSIHGSFTFNSSGAHGNFRFNREWGGGSIYDIGVYPISAARFLLQAEPVAATVVAFHSPEHGMVDMMASGLLEFPGHVGLTFDCGMWAAGRNTLEIVGTEGRIEVPSAYVSPLSDASNFQVTVKGERREVVVPQVNSYAVQADDFARAVWGEQPPLKPPVDAVYNMKAVDACLQSAEKRERIVI